MISTLAPIVLFVYNRSWHTEQTLNALMQNDLADESVLYIYADGPKEDVTDEQREDIKKVRQIIRNKQWCKEIHFVEAEINKGLANSIIDGVTKIIKDFGKVIVLEDDIITSRFFLRFMNKSLDLYFNDDKVKTISGYLEPINFKQQEPFFLNKGSSWGWGTWERVWNKAIWDAGILIDTVIKQKKINDLNFSGYPYFEMLKDQINGKIDSWAIRFYAYCCLENGLHLTPPRTLVNNIGFDGSGVHCGLDLSVSQNINNTKLFSFNKIPIILNEKVPLFIKKQREAEKTIGKKKLFRSFFSKTKNIIKKTLTRNSHLKF